MAVINWEDYYYFRTFSISHIFGNISAQQSQWDSLVEE